MTRILWLVGTIIVGSAISVASWFAVRELPTRVQAAQPPVANNPHAGGETVPPLPPPVTQNLNDQEAPPVAGDPAKGKTFIGSLRSLLEDSPDLGPEFREHGDSLEQAEKDFLRIKRENKAALLRVKRRPPVSIPQSPNFVLIDAPGLGYADLATFSRDVEFGLALDRLAQAGLVFTNYYAASASPAANSCAMLTALHTGRTRIRGTEPTVPLALDDLTLPEVLWRAGYATGMWGEWRLGGSNTSGAPTRQGFEEAWFTNLQDAEGELIVWNGTERVEEKDQPTDLAGFYEMITNRSISFLDRHRTEPVFVYLSFPAEGAGSVELTTNMGNELARLTETVRAMKFPRETYFFLAGSAGKNIPASQAPEETVKQFQPDSVSVPPEPLPAEVGTVAVIPGAKAPAPPPTPQNEVIEVESPPAENQTANGETTTNGEQDASLGNTLVGERTIVSSELLQKQTAREVAGLRGAVGDLFEGGLRAPLLVWTVHRPLGGVRNDVVAAWDFLPTLAGLSYAQFVPTSINGVPFSDRLQVHGDTANLPLHPALYWESHVDGFNRAMLFGKWKLIQLGEAGPVALYNLETDPAESRDVSAQQPELVEKLTPLLDRVRTKTRHWPRAGEEFPAPVMDGK